MGRRYRRAARRAASRVTERRTGTDQQEIATSAAPMPVALRAQAEKAEKAWRARHPGLAEREMVLGRELRAMARDHGHRLHGTVQTLAHAARLHQGAVARLFEAGHVSLDQLSAAQEIVATHGRIVAGVSVACASLETRVDGGGRGADVAPERFGQVLREMAYGKWRDGLMKEGRSTLGVALAVIVDDVAISRAARHFAMRNASAREVLGRALDAWRRETGAMARELRAG